jgi:c-di-AMP phosphodiesterase-like protein
MKKYLKLVNVPLVIFSAPRYGNRISGGPIPWQAMGFNSLVTKSKSVQYIGSNSDSFTYLPIVDESKVNAILPKILEDIEILKTFSPEKSFIFEIVEDNYDSWKNQAEESKTALITE